MTHRTMKVLCLALIVVFAATLALFQTDSNPVLAKALASPTLRSNAK